MVTEIIGAQPLFAIEYVGPINDKSQLRPVRLWINGLPFGTLDSDTYLPSFRHQLERFVHPEIHLAGDEITEDDREDVRSWIAFGDTFDDFLIRRFGSGDQLLISVQLVEDPFFPHPLLGKGTTYTAAVPLQFARKVVAEFNGLQDKPA